MSSNNELDKFKGDGIQDVNAWFTNYEQWTNVHDLHYLKTTPLLAVKEHPLTCSLYIFNVLANHQLQIIKVPHLYPLPNQLVFELILDHKFTPSQCRINKFLKKKWRETSLGHLGMIYLLMVDSIFTVLFACSVVQKHSCLARVHRQFILN